MTISDRAIFYFGLILCVTPCMIEAVSSIAAVFGADPDRAFSWQRRDSAPVRQKVDVTLLLPNPFPSTGRR